MRDALPEDMQNIYYIAGEGSTIALALCTLGVGDVAIYGSLNKMQSAVENQQHVMVEVGSEGGTDVLDEINRIDEIKVEFNYNSKYDETEFARQLADQQKGMNELTVQEYLDNRQKYIEQGRAIESNSAQLAAREKAFVDKVAGGHASNVGGVGDKGVNSSIGSQWRYRIDDVDAQIQRMSESMSEAERNSTYLNVNLIYKGD